VLLHGSRLGLLDLGLGRLRRADLETDALELARHLLDLDLAEIVLEDERLEVGRLDEAALLRTLDERARVVCVKQFVELIRRKSGSLFPFFSKTSAELQTFAL
jgi:hypothetical protein